MLCFLPQTNRTPAFFPEAFFFAKRWRRNVARECCVFYSLTSEKCAGEPAPLLAITGMLTASDTCKRGRGV